MVALDRVTVAKIRRDYTMGKPIPDICKKYGVCRATVYNNLKPGVRRGSPRRKLTEAAHDVIVRLNFQGYSDGYIAKKLGVRRGTVLEWRREIGLPAVVSPRERDKWSG